MNISGLVGYGTTWKSTYVGGDARVGYGWGKTSKNAVIGGNTIVFNAHQRWTGGIGINVGHECAHDLLAFFRLGLDVNMYEMKFIAQGNYLTKGITSLALVPGIGMKWKLDHSTYVTGMYEHSRQLSANTFAGFKSHSLNSHGIKVGVGYQF
jgi:opacity protein-like surface antigen